MRKLSHVGCLHDVHDKLVETACWVWLHVGVSMCKCANV